MMSLFSSFDLSMFLPQIFLTFMAVFSIIIFKHNKVLLLGFLCLKLNLFFMNFFSSLTESNSTKNFINFLVSMMSLIFMLNFYSNFSFNFAFSTQVSLIFFLSLMFWVSLMTFSLKSNLKGQVSHFMPEGSPLFLSPFLSMIEMVSITIRPLTLMVRLVANILAGHLLVILLSSLIYNFNSFIPFLSALNLAESLVSLIQSYILVTLMALYYSEL